MVLLGCIEFGTYDWISCAAWRIQICCVKMKSLLYFRSACLWLAFHASHIRCWTTPGWDCKMLTRSSFSRWWGGCGGTGPKFLDSMVVATWETWCDSFCDRCQSFCHLPSQGDYPRKCVGVPPDSGEGGRADQEEPSGEPWLQKVCVSSVSFSSTLLCLVIHSSTGTISAATSFARILALQFWATQFWPLGFCDLAILA